MMTVAMELTRRGWILGVTAMADIAAAQQHVHEAIQSGGPPKLEVVDAVMAAELDALTSQIIPSSDGPGAREAGVIYFIDRALATFEADKREAYHAGMNEIQEARRKMFPKSANVAGLTSAEQIALLHTVEKSEFFELLRTHTVWGFVGSPSYGGNRGKVGWTHIGFDDRMIFEPPFGYYDAHAREFGES
jgi:gluconate 2-dehydrogenase gamma chain